MPSDRVGVGGFQRTPVIQEPAKTGLAYMGGESRTVPVYWDAASAALTPEEQAAGWTVQTINKRTGNPREGNQSSYQQYYKLRPRPEGQGMWGQGYYIAPQHLDWIAHDGSGGGGLGGFIDKLTPESVKNSAIGNLVQAPIKSVASTIDSIGSGENVGSALSKSLAIDQGAITGALDSWGGRAGEAIADYGRKLTNAEGTNLRQQGQGLEQIGQGQVSKGLNTAEEAGRNFIRDPNVAPIAIALASYFGAPYISGLFGGGIAGAAGAGATLGAGSARAMGVENSQGLLKAAGTGAVGGLASGIGQGIGGTTGAVAGGAVGGAGTTAAQGGNREEILRAGLMGGAQGLASAGLGNLGKQYGIDPWLTKIGSGALTGALRGGSEGAERGAFSGFLSGIGGQYGGQVGATAGNLLAKSYYANQNPQQYLNSRPTQGMMGGNAGNSALSRYTPQQQQQLYAQYLAQRKA